jgi:hypothetical protein
MGRMKGLSMIPSGLVGFHAVERLNSCDWLNATVIQINQPTSMNPCWCQGDTGRYGDCFLRVPSWDLIPYAHENDLR